MIRIVIVSVMVIILSAFAFGQNYAYVLNGMAETLSRVELETGQVENHVVTLGSVPNQVVYHDGSLYVVNSYSPSLMVIEPITNTVISEIPLPVNSNPWNVAVLGQYAYVTGLATNSVYKIGLFNSEITDTWETGTSPEGILINGDRVYVTNTAFNPIDYSYGQGSITVFEIYDGDVLGTVNVGVNPQNLVIGPDDFLNVICTGDYGSNSGMVYFIDQWDLLATDSLSLGGSPTEVVIHPNGQAYVAAGGWTDDGHVYEYDPVNRTVSHGPSNPIELNTGVMGMAVDDLGVLYATCQMSNTVNSFTPDGAIEGTFNLGSGPSSIAIIDNRVSIAEADVNLPTDVKLGMPYPNPFNSSVNIPVNGITGEGENIVEIFDITGRLVKRLIYSDGQTINNNVTWSGKDIAGQEVATGVYFARLSGNSQSVKMVLLR